MTEEGTEDLLFDRLVTGDRPSLYAVGMVAAQALKETGIAVFMTDALGRVHCLPKSFIEIKRGPRLSDDELDAFSEDEALTLLLRQEEKEEEIIKYMKRRASRERGL